MPTEFHGLTLQEGWIDFFTYEGPRLALVQSGLVPTGSPFPGEVPGRHGVRWRDSDGRRNVLSKWHGTGIFRLTVHYTPAEIRVRELRAAREAEKAKIERQLGAVEVSAQQFRAEHVSFCEMFMRVSAFNGRRPSAWQYDEGTREQIEYHMGAIIDLFTDGPLERRTVAIDSMKSQLQRLADPQFQTMLERLV